MKKQVLLALGACCALCFPIQAQDSVENPTRDTLIIVPNENMKILFIGPGIETMKNYKWADSLKNFFLADLARARQQPNYPAESRMTHYFVHPNGKRRLKAESEDYQEPALNVEKEIRSMDLNLPAYAYIIHDIAASSELQMYLQGPQDLPELENVSLTDAIRSIAAAKKRERRYSSIELKKDHGEWLRKVASHKKRNALELHTVIGCAVIGSQLSPEFGVELAYVFNDRHSVPRFKLGVSSSYFFLTEYANKEFSNFYDVSSTNVTILAREGNRSTGRWLGFELGYMKADGGYLDEMFKFGFIYALRSFQVGLHILSPTSPKRSDDDILYALTFRSLF